MEWKKYFNLKPETHVSIGHCLTRKTLRKTFAMQAGILLIVLNTPKSALLFETV